jgi:DNA-binding transcriptional regulator YiaG
VAQAEDDELFRQLFNDAQAVLEMEDSELALKFQVSRPTINRWAAGRTVPHPIARKAVIEQLAKMISNQQRYI